MPAQPYRVRSTAEAAALLRNAGLKAAWSSAVRPIAPGKPAPETVELWTVERPGATGSVVHVAWVPHLDERLATLDDPPETQALWAVYWTPARAAFGPEALHGARRSQYESRRDPVAVEVEAQLAGLLHGCAYDDAPSWLRAAGLVG